MNSVEQSENGRYIVHDFKDIAGKSESELLTAEVRKHLFDFALKLIHRIEKRYDSSTIP